MLLIAVELISHVRPTKQQIDSWRETSGFPYLPLWCDDIPPSHRSSLPDTAPFEADITDLWRHFTGLLAG